ncbi:MAG: lysophospholipid acyltransferase family protein [Phycisphaeraceae bacterium]|nr:lysophospholipid acyltransferase family protein [Phycisphaeraceae bacterium]
MSDAASARDGAKATARHDGRAAMATTTGAAPRRSMVATSLENALFALLLIPMARWTPGLSRLVRPLLARFTWMLMAGRRRSLRRTGRILFGPRASPEALDRFGRRVLENIQSFIADVASIDRCTVAEVGARVVHFENLDRFMSVVSERRGAILVSAHLGSFESAVAAMRRVCDTPVHVLFARDHITAFDRVRSRARRHLGIVEHPVGDGVQSWLELHDALKRGELVTILADRTMPGQRGTATRFFGQSAELPLGPLRLAAASGAPLLPTFALPTLDGQWTLRFEPLIEVEPDGRTLDGEHPAQRRMVEAMERAIQEAPEHWLVVAGPWSTPA